MVDSLKLLPTFELSSLEGDTFSYSGTGPALICFVKDDCPTCHLVIPLLQAMHHLLDGAYPIFLIGQTRDGNQKIKEHYHLTLPILDDSDLLVSFAYGIDTVPSVFLADASRDVLPDQTETQQQSAPEPQLVGFVHDEWHNLLSAELQRLNLPEIPAEQWSELPEWRPGCGSLSVDPVHATRLQATAENSPIRARRVQLGDLEDPIEFMFDQGFSDGLPLVPPTPERVLAMLSTLDRDAQEVIAEVPPNMGRATIEKIAINAVMAGCKPEYLRVVVAAMQAVCNETFNIHGVMATTMGASPVLLVNGPIRHSLDMNMKIGALGQGNRANATIGRALRLAIRNIGGAKPGGTERSTLGNPMKFTMCFAEWEERNPWSPLHVERGFEADDSVVTAFAMTSGPTLIVDQDSRSAVQLAGSFGMGLESVFHPKTRGFTDVLLVICPEHVDTLWRDRFDKDDIRQTIQRVTERSIRDLAADDVCGVGFKPAALAKMSATKQARRLPKFGDPQNIHLVVAGSDAGKFSGAFHGWATGAGGSIPVSQKIDV